MNVKCIITDIDGNATTLTRCLSFTLRKDRYAPTSTLTAEFLAEGDENPPCAVQFAIEGQTVFHGVPKNASISRTQGVYRLSFQAESYGAALARNQLTPGVYTSVTLASLLTKYSLTGLTYEAISDPISYLYVEEDTPLWDAVVAFCYKYNGGYPFLKFPNCVTVGQGAGAAFTLPQRLILSRGTGENLTHMVSRIDMADADGSYGAFTATNTAATARNITRVQQIGFDLQYPNDPQLALSQRIAYGNRGMAQRMVHYLGYMGEDLHDKMTVAENFTATVGALVISGDGKGISTELIFYYDSFDNIT